MTPLLGRSREEIARLLDGGEVRVSVYGLGRVGLPLAAAWLRAGQRVVGADIDGEVASSLNRGESPITDEPGVADAVRRFTAEGRLRATTDLTEAASGSEVHLIAVPTTGPEKRFERGALERALRDVAEGLKPGDAISIESTVPPTTTENWARRLLEEASGLAAEEEFALVHSPERIYAGRALADIEERYPKVIGGVGPRSLELFSALYGRLARRGVVEMSSATAAELAKLFEGVYRDVNIALANELAGICEALAVEYAEVRRASNSQPFCHLHLPGVGVGGPCIPHYPYFLLKAAEGGGLSMPLTRLSRSINEAMPGRTFELARHALGAIDAGLAGARVAILGLAYRGGVADPRNSPTYHLVDLLRGHGAIVVVHDPLIGGDEALAGRGVELTRSLEAALRGSSLAIVASDHEEYGRMDLDEMARMMRSPAAIVDGRNLIDADRLPEGVHLVGIGRKTVDRPRGHEGDAR